jgi:large subunit ribosomal protein L25
MDAIKIEAHLRTDLSKQATLKLRKTEQVPCVIYGGSEVMHFYVSSKAIRPLVYTPDFKIAHISLNGQTIEAIIQDKHFDPITDALAHVDFLQLTGKAVTVELPVKFTGVAKGVRAGGKLIARLRKLKVSSLPSALRSNLEINVEELELGRHIRVKDVQFEGIDIVTAPNNPIVSAFVTRQLKQEEASKPAAAKPAAGAAAAPAAAKPAAKK